MQDLIRPDASFTPRELFSRMQGAWFEPRLGYMWQEHTGVTPTTSGGQTIGKLVDLSAERVASQATAANRPTYQLDAKSLPYLAHDSTDSLSVSLPAINVRRNLLRYSEQFDNAAWMYGSPTTTVVADAAISPIGTTTADKIIFSGVGNDWRYLGIAPVGGSVYTIWLRVASGTKKVALRTWYGLQLISANITTEWQRFTLQVTNGETTAVGLDNRAGVSGSGTAGSVYAWGAQLELGSVATEYQKITDWTSEQYSSAGSVYFSTPQGMSCLHNQSIGTSYNLPALQTDIYGVVITPARLAPPLEQRLALYMHRLAGLSDADFFWQEQATDGMTGQLLTDDIDTILLRA